MSRSTTFQTQNAYSRSSNGTTILSLKPLPLLISIMEKRWLWERDWFKIRKSYSYSISYSYSNLKLSIIWPNCSLLKRSILIGPLSSPNFQPYGLLRWTAHKLISLICVLEKISKGKLFGVKLKPFSCCLTKNVAKFQSAKLA